MVHCACFVCYCSVTKLCPTLCDSMTAACQAPLSSTLSWSLLKFMTIEPVLLSTHLLLSNQHVTPFSVFPSINIFSNELAVCIRGQNIGASASVLPVNIQGWYSLGLTGLIFLQSKGLSKSLFQHHSSKASIVWHSAFFMVLLSYPYMTAGKAIALTRQTFVSKIMSLLFGVLSRFFIAFLPRSKCLLFSWLQSLSTVILEPKIIESATVLLFLFLFAMKYGTGFHDLNF